MAADNWLVEGVRSPCIKTLECSLPAFCSLLWPFFFFVLFLFFSFFFIIYTYIHSLYINICLTTILVNIYFFTCY